eukprot:TRINITY_DN4965_c0_g1_i6.p1 TRINITY_DN4965_c0_g1~~TRINITY_DN4965_c0_g1_i6.p1  ORF type:complete len:159 (-),score=4.01 TRINITY_DN4965_c0_g1_i6:384-860(-)
MYTRASTSVVNLVSACRALRVGDVPVCVGRITSGEQCDHVRRGQRVFRIVEIDVTMTFAWMMKCAVADEVLGSLLGLIAPTLRILRGTGMSDLSGLRDCDSLHTLNLTQCTNLSDVSGLCRCWHSAAPSAPSISLDATVSPACRGLGSARTGTYLSRD